MERRPPSICSHYPCNPISFSLSVSLSRSLSYFLALIFTRTAGICLEWRHILTHSEWESFWGFIYTRSTSLVLRWIIVIVPVLLSLAHLSDDARIDTPPSPPSWAQSIKWPHGFRSTFIQFDVSHRHMSLNLWVLPVWLYIYMHFMKNPVLHRIACDWLPDFVLNTSKNPAVEVRKCFWGSGRTVK